MQFFEKNRSSGFAYPSENSSQQEQRVAAGSGGETWHRVNDVLFFMTVNPRAVIPVGIKPTDFGIATRVKPATISWRPAAPLPRSAAPSSLPPCVHGSTQCTVFLTKICSIHLLYYL